MLLSVLLVRVQRKDSQVTRERRIAAEIKNKCKKLGRKQVFMGNNCTTNYREIEGGDSLMKLAFVVQRYGEDIIGVQSI